MQQPLQFKPHALRLVWVWLCLPGLFLSAFAFWQSLVQGVLFLLVWCGLCGVLCLERLHLLRAHFTKGELCVQAGVVLPTLRRVPLRFVTSVTQFHTPLLSALGCCVLVVRTAGCLVLLPGVEQASAQALCALVQTGEMP